MLKSVYPYEKVSQLAKTDIAYVTGDRSLTPFFKYDLKNETFKKIIEDKSHAQTPRQLLVKTLREQYKKLHKQDVPNANIEALLDEKCFTVTTAHQPALFLGPLYFVYKALTTINLAEAAKGLVSQDYHIVPIFVLGSEDHDIDELNHINLFGKKVEWHPTEKGAVGDISTASLAPVLEKLYEILGDSDTGQNLKSKIKAAYDGKRSFAEATQALLHELFGRWGLVVLNMNNPEMKREFLPIMREELLKQTAYKLVNETTEQLNNLGFKTQASPREINLFYMMPGLRERIVLERGLYKVLNTNLLFTESEVLAELEAHPERFSPNVVLRPLYQETILPNLAYVGGGGELAYWLERKKLFEHFGINFPLLVRRNSVVWLDRDLMRRLQKFGFSASRIFDDVEVLIKDYIAANADAEVNLSVEMTEMRKIFEKIERKANAIDQSLVASVQADSLKFVAGVEQWQHRLLRAEKQKHEGVINQIRTVRDRVFPGGSLQERADNFMAFFLKYGEFYFHELKEKLLPLERGFIVLEDKS